MILDQQQARKVQDALLASALVADSLSARQLMNSLLTSAERIIVLCKVTDPANDGQRASLNVQIQDYLYVHERLRPLEEDLLPSIKTVLNELNKRSQRLLQLPSTSQRKKQALKTFRDNYYRVLGQVEGLYRQTTFMSSGTGFGAEQLRQIEHWQNGVDAQKRWDALVRELIQEIAGTKIRKVLREWAAAEARVRVSFL
jgi:hypothetical protein